MRERLKWEYYQSLIKDNRSGLHSAAQDYWFPDGEPDQMPEVYLTYQQCHEWNKLWWEGGIADQPHLLMMEFDACAAGVAEFRDEDAPAIGDMHRKGFSESTSGAQDIWKNLPGGHPGRVR